MGSNDLSLFSPPRPQVEKAPDSRAGKLAHCGRRPQRAELSKRVKPCWLVAKHDLAISRLCQKYVSTPRDFYEVMTAELTPYLKRYTTKVVSAVRSEHEPGLPAMPKYILEAAMSPDVKRHVIETNGMDRADAAVEQWARERPDLPTLPMAVFGRLSEVAERVMREHVNPLFAQAGLQPGEFDVLATLRRSGEPYMLSPTRLYEATMISSGGMTDRLDRLERAGLVERHPDLKGPSRQTDSAHRRRQAPNRRDDRAPCGERAAAAVRADPRRAGNARRAAEETARRAMNAAHDPRAWAP